MSGESVNYGDVVAQYRLETGQFGESVSRIVEGYGEVAGSLIGLVGHLRIVDLGFAGLATAAIKSYSSTYDVVRQFTRETNLAASATQTFKDQLDELSSTTPDELNVIGNVMAKIEARTGLAGQAATRVADSYLAVSRIFGTGAGQLADIGTNISQLFGISGPEAMDKFAIATKMSGASINDLMSTMQQSGAVFKDLGYSFDQTLALMANFEKLGVGSKAIMGIRSAMMTEGVSGPQIASIISEISRLQKTGQTQDAFAMTERFFKRGAPELVPAIARGAFDTGPMLDAVSKSAGIVDTMKKDLNIGEIFTIELHKAEIAIRPIGELFTNMAKQIAPITGVIWNIVGAFTGLLKTPVSKWAAEILIGLTAIRVAFLPLIGLISVVKVGMAGAWAAGIGGVGKNLASPFVEGTRIIQGGPQAVLTAQTSVKNAAAMTLEAEAATAKAAALTLDAETATASALASTGNSAAATTDATAMTAEAETATADALALTNKAAAARASAAADLLAAEGAATAAVSFGAVALALGPIILAIVAIGVAFAGISALIDEAAGKYTRFVEKSHKGNQWQQFGDFFKWIAGQAPKDESFHDYYVHPKVDMNDQKAVAAALEKTKADVIQFQKDVDNIPEDDKTPDAEHKRYQLRDAQDFQAKLQRNTPAEQPIIPPPWIEDFYGKGSLFWQKVQQGTIEASNNAKEYGRVIQQIAGDPTLTEANKYGLQAQAKLAQQKVADALELGQYKADQEDAADKQEREHAGHIDARMIAIIKRTAEVNIAKKQADQQQHQADMQNDAQIKQAQIERAAAYRQAMRQVMVDSVTFSAAQISAESSIRHEQMKLIDTADNVEKVRIAGATHIFEVEKKNAIELSAKQIDIEKQMALAHKTMSAEEVADLQKANDIVLAHMKNRHSIEQTDAEAAALHNERVAQHQEDVYKGSLSLRTIALQFTIDTGLLSQHTETIKHRYAEAFSINDRSAIINATHALEVQKIQTRAMIEKQAIIDHGNARVKKQIDIDNMLEGQAKEMQHQLQAEEFARIEGVAAKQKEADADKLSADLHQLAIEDRRRDANAATIHANIEAQYVAQELGEKRRAGYAEMYADIIGGIYSAQVHAQSELNQADIDFYKTKANAEATFNAEKIKSGANIDVLQQQLNEAMTNAWNTLQGKKISVELTLEKSKLEQFKETVMWGVKHSVEDDPRFQAGVEKGMRGMFAYAAMRGLNGLAPATASMAGFQGLNIPSIPISNLPSVVPPAPVAPITLRIALDKENLKVFVDSEVNKQVNVVMVPVLNRLGR